MSFTTLNYTITAERVINNLMMLTFIRCWWYTITVFCTTNPKLAKRIIYMCNQFAEQIGVNQPQSYTCYSKWLIQDTFKPKHIQNDSWG